jgi:CAAX protease family protein
MGEMVAAGPRDQVPERAPLHWGTLVGVLVLGVVLAVVLLVMAGVAYAQLLAAESRGALPKGAVRDALASWGIGEQSALVMVTGALIYVAFFVAVWLVVGRARGGWRSLGIRPAPLAAFAWVLPAYLVTMVVSGAVTALEAALFLHGHLDNPQQAIFAGDTRHTVAQIVVFLAVIAIIGPIVEELLFRGLLYQILRQALPLWVAVGLSALLFALAHGIPILLPPLFVFGVALALVFEYTRSLYCSVFLHILINTVAVVAALPPR